MLWKALPRIRWAKTRFDCALMARPGAFLKDDGFDFTEAVGRRRGRRGNPPLSSRPALRRAMKPRSGEPGRRSEGCLRRASERSDRLDPQAAMRKAGQHGAPGNGAAKC